MTFYLNIYVNAEIQNLLEDMQLILFTLYISQWFLILLKNSTFIILQLLKFIISIVINN